MKKLVPALLLISLFITSCGKPSPFEEKAALAMQTIIERRDSTTAVWENAGWWNSANVLTAVIRYSAVKGTKEFYPVIDDVFTRAQKYFLRVDTITGDSVFCRNFINDYYDDEGWWALAWIDAYKLIGDQKYLEMAETIFADMILGWSDECGGSIYWRKDPWVYKNSIAGNLFSLTAIRLFNATGDKQYLDWFEKNVDWFMHTGLINTETYQVFDGMGRDDCKPRGAYFTYNQGVAIAVLTEMYRHGGDREYLDLAEKIAQGTMTHLTTPEGILREARPRTETSGDGVQFKGVFIRHLGFLYDVSKNPIYRDFLIRNAESIITNNYDPATRSFGHYWYGPFSELNTAANSSALECVIEAYRLTK